MRRIPYTWVRQTRPGGIILATVGSWSYGTGLARLVVGDDGAAEGRIVGRASFMPARAHAPVPLSGDLKARAAYPDSERRARIPPETLDAWEPAFLAQLAAPGARWVRSVRGDGQETVYLFDVERESFAALVPGPVPGPEGGWTVRQGGPVTVWDAVEDAVAAWREIGEPDLARVRLRVTARDHMYWFDGHPRLRWSHPIT